MNPTAKVTVKVDSENKEIIKSENDTSSISNRIIAPAADIFAKYPLEHTLTKLDSTLEIKQNWLYNEWAPQCQFSKFIRQNFPNRSDLDPETESV